MRRDHEEKEPCAICGAPSDDRLVGRNGDTSMEFRCLAHRDAEPLASLILNVKVAKSRKSAWVRAATRAGKNLEGFILDAADSSAGLHKGK